MTKNQTNKQTKPHTQYAGCILFSLFCHSTDISISTAVGFIIHLQHLFHVVLFVLEGFHSSIGPDAGEQTIYATVLT